MRLNAFSSRMNRIYYLNSIVVETPKIRSLYDSSIAKQAFALKNYELKNLLLKNC